MSLVPTKANLYVVVDFEGLRSLERTPQGKKDYYSLGSSFMPKSLMQSLYPIFHTHTYATCTITLEDMLLTVFNAAISNLILYKNNFAIGRDIATMFRSFQVCFNIVYL